MLHVFRQPYTPTLTPLHLPERPGWIPDDIGEDWDPDPYAYQTEEEIMPAGTYHGLFLMMVIQMLDGYVQTLGLTMLQDVFVSYRDEQDEKKRLAPDIVLAPVATLTEEQLVGAYDLDVDHPPVCLVEITSPSSHKHDLEEKCYWYALWGVEEYLVFDIVDRRRVLQEVQCSLWRLYGNSYLRVIPDPEGYLPMQSIGVKVRAVGRQPELRVLATDELLRTKQQEAERAQDAEELAQQEAQRAQQEAQRAQQEAILRQDAEELAQQEAQRAQQEAQRAKEEAQRAKEEAQRAQQEAILRQDAEDRAQQEAQRAQASEDRVKQLEEEIQRMHSKQGEG